MSYINNIIMIRSGTCGYLYRHDENECENLVNLQRDKSSEPMQSKG